MNPVLAAYLINYSQGAMRGPTPYPVRDALEDLWDELATPKYEVWLPYPQADTSFDLEDSGTVCREIPGYPLWLCTDEDQGVYVTRKADAQDWCLVPEEVAH